MAFLQGRTSNLNWANWKSGPVGLITHPGSCASTTIRLVATKKFCVIQLRSYHLANLDTVVLHHLIYHLLFRLLSRPVLAPHQLIVQSTDRGLRVRRRSCRPQLQPDYWFVRFYFAINTTEHRMFHSYECGLSTSCHLANVGIRQSRARRRKLFSYQTSSCPIPYQVLP